MLEECVDAHLSGEMTLVEFVEEPSPYGARTLRERHVHEPPGHGVLKVRVISCDDVAEVGDRPLLTLSAAFRDSIRHVRVDPRQSTRFEPKCERFRHPAAQAEGIRGLEIPVKSAGLAHPPEALGQPAMPDGKRLMPPEFEARPWPRRLHHVLFLIKSAMVFATRSTCSSVLRIENENLTLA